MVTGENTCLRHAARVDWDDALSFPRKCNKYSEAPASNTSLGPHPPGPHDPIILVKGKIDGGKGGPGIR